MLEQKCADFAAEAARGKLKRSSLSDFIEVVESASSLLVGNLKRAADLVQSFKQVAVDRSYFDRSQFDLGEVTEQVLSNLRPALPKNNLTLEVDCPAGLAMNSYPGPYGQALTNLFVNSVAHAFPDGKGGSITIRLRALGADRVEILVADDGCGMSRDVLRHMPEFFQKPTVLGVGEIGFHETTKNEEEIFEAQVELALQHRQLILIHTPHMQDKVRGTKRTLEVLSHIYFKGFMGRSDGFSLVDMGDSWGLGVYDVGFYGKVTEMKAYKGLKVAKEGDHSNTLMGLRCHRKG